MGDSLFDKINKAQEGASTIDDIKKVYNVCDSALQKQKSTLLQNLDSLKDTQQKLSNILSQLDALKSSATSDFFGLSDAHSYDTQTDADGNFDIFVPKKDDYFIFCKAGRLIDADHQEDYIWAVPLAFNGETSKVVQLNNNNEILSGKSDILTIDNNRPNNDVPTVITLLRTFVQAE
jgi:hypothetical protein